MGRGLGRLVLILGRWILILGLLAGGGAATAQRGPGAPPGLDAGTGWIVQVVPGETAVDTGPGEYLRAAAIGPGNFQPGPSSGDWAVYRSINVPADAPDQAWCHPNNNFLFEVPNLRYVDRTAFGGRGACYAAHLTTNPLHIGIPAGTLGRPKLTTNHAVIKWSPNPDAGRPGCVICGTHLITEVSARIIQIAFSPSQGSEVWYFKDAFGQVLHGGNDKIVLKKTAGGGYAVDPDSNFKLATRVSYGDGQTPLRPGDETLPKVSFDIKMRPAAGSLPVAGVSALYKTDLYPLIPRNSTGHTYELVSDEWLKCPLPAGYDARTFPVIGTMPDHCRFTGREGRGEPATATATATPQDGGPLTDPTPFPEPTSTAQPTIEIGPTPTPLPEATPLPTEEPATPVAPTETPVIIDVPTETPAPPTWTPAPVEPSPTAEPAEATATPTATPPPATAVPTQAGTTQRLDTADAVPLENAHLEWIPNPECQGGATRITDERLAFDWGEEEPEGMPDAGWCIKARTHLLILAGRSLDRLLVRSDDGIRVWVDHRLVLDAWETPPYRTQTVDAMPDGVPFGERFRGRANYEVNIQYRNVGPGGNARLSVLAQSDEPAAP